MISAVRPGSGASPQGDLMAKEIKKSGIFWLDFNQAIESGLVDTVGLLERFDNFSDYANRIDNQAVKVEILIRHLKLFPLIAIQDPAEKRAKMSAFIDKIIAQVEQLPDSQLFEENSKRQGLNKINQLVRIADFCIRSLELFENGKACLEKAIDIFHTEQMEDPSEMNLGWSIENLLKEAELSLENEQQLTALYSRLKVISNAKRMMVQAVQLMMPEVYEI